MPHQAYENGFYSPFHTWAYGNPLLDKQDAGEAYRRYRNFLENDFGTVLDHSKMLHSGVTL